MKNLHRRGGGGCPKWVWRLVTVSLISLFVLLSLSVLYMTENLPVADSLTSSSDNGDDAVFDEKMKLRMTRRRKVVDEVCAREGIGKFAKKGRISNVQHPPTPNYEAFYFDRKDRLAWCPIYKCASTSWLYNLCLLAGLTDREIKESKLHISDLARKLYPYLEFEDGEMAMNASKVKFFMVRHPFQRILSAYRDKLENKDIGKKHGTLHYYKAYGRKIVKKYRKKQQLSSTGKESDTPNRYKQVIEKEMDQNTLRDLLREELEHPKSPERPEPTFKEFVTYLTDVNLLVHGDDHWMPYYAYCTPCFINYDVIGKFETLGDDQKYLIKLAKLEDKIQPQWRHLTKGKQTSRVIKNYYSTIPKELLMKLYEKYRLDFEMFEYTIDDYLNYVQ